MKKYNKKGISLIVLIITIIVMIILAAAIILSISNSGIMDKANKAKQDSDTANLKEYANVLEAEWELMTPEERNGKTSVEYVNEELSKKYQNKTYSADGEIYADLSNIAKNAILKGLKIGDEVKYTVTTNKYTPDSSKTGCSNDKLTTQTDLKWIYIGVNDNGEPLITPDVSGGVPANSYVKLYGKQGWLTGPEELNTICDKLYTVTGKGTARSMDIDDVTRILGYTGEKGAYCEPTNGAYTPTMEAKKIGDLEKELGKTLIYRNTPESGKNLEDYYSNYYYISKTDDLKEMKSSKYVDLIYLKSTTSGPYWLASSCVQSYFYGDYTYALFSVFYVYDSTVSSSCMFHSLGSDTELQFSIRPVVTITSNIQKSTENGSTVWSV